ncbi:uncharacterized protein BXZ73DRAFT_99499 [Epithele typhae]|uniref:uncharacterized protein n=1 Tax=Epithele typhae TaxID=378194 RepID=UPI0020079906|nr:uncharacterized protein BXZ73DRAFT_99499 [Epithele typhae]KAH9939297.1 hypothetical protein BXZ73DRAFT_99499 [Epithele typhae]
MSRRTSSHANYSSSSRRGTRVASHIHDLPIELVQQVFLFACTDGGLMGCSLSRVSRSFRTAAHPVRYHSIALTGLGQIASFTAHYQHVLAAAARSSNPGAYPKVQHLYAMSHKEMLRRKVFEHDDDDDDDLDLAFSALALDPRPASASTLAPLPALLQLVAPDVVTLCLATVYTHTTLFAGCGPFRALRQLTVARMQGVDVPPARARPLPTPLFPALEELHIAMGVLDHSFEHLFCHWTELAPRTAALRLSDVPWRVGASCMCETFGERPRNYDPVFPSLRVLFVQPFPSPPPGRAEAPALSAQRRELMHAITDLGRHPRRGTAVRVLQQNNDCGAQHSVDLRRGWLEGVAGRSGFWAGGVDARM